MKLPSIFSPKSTDLLKILTSLLQLALILVEIIKTMLK
jgi:hypothetical protein